MANDYFPDPPTPISIPLPLGYLNILDILSICSTASSKNTRSNLSFEVKTYSSYLSSKALTIILRFSVTSSYRGAAASSFNMSEKMMLDLNSSSLVDYIFTIYISSLLSWFYSQSHMWYPGTISYPIWKLVDLRTLD